jgi:hypothetical protein
VRAEDLDQRVIGGVPDNARGRSLIDLMWKHAEVRVAWTTLRRPRGGVVPWRRDASPRIKARAFIWFAMLVVLSAAPPGLPARVSGGDENVRRVVILNATDPYLPAFVALDSALRAAIRKDSKVPVELFAETLDMHRCPRKLLDRDVIALWQKKYHDLKVDVVVALAPIALDFARRHRDDIWPDAAIVFNGVSSTLLADRKAEPHIIGVPQRLEIGETLDLALRLRPQTRRIVVIASSGDCCAQPAVLREVLERYADRIDAKYLVDLSVADTLDAVAALEPDAVVF